MAARLFVATFVVQLLFTVLAQAQAPAQSAGAYDFAYRITGDRRVAPVQVFDDGRDTYLQFRAHQTIPAIFSIDGGGERLATHTLKDPYVVIAGTNRKFVMRIGEVSANAAYQGAARRAGSPVPIPQDDDLDGGSPAAMPGSWTNSPAPRQAVRSVDRPAPMPVNMPAFDATLADQNMRTALARWAKSAGWTFQPEHWTVDVDIPLAGSASFGSEFKTAARQLLASTELSTRPLQPCFYSNKVLRVIPLLEQCNRTAATTALR